MTTLSVSGLTTPQLADEAPVPESRLANGGAGGMASRWDHEHPRLTSSTRVVLGADGTATVTYTRSFSKPPVVLLTAINPTGRQIVLEQGTDIQTGALYTGCTVRGYRNRPLPELAPVGGLLTAVVTGVNAVASNLTNFDVLGGSAAGVEVNVVAIMPSN